MKRFRNVLLVAGLDDGPVPRHIFDRALSLSKRNEAKLTLIDIVDEVELSREDQPSEMLQTVLRDRRQSLTRLAGVAQEEGVEVETELALGKPFLVIARRVRSLQHDLVMTDGGRDEDAGGLIDSTTMHLMRKCPCAIWVVRPQPGNQYTRVLAAVDPDPTDPEGDSLDQRIMELAISLANLEASELHVVHAWKQSGVPAGSPEIWAKWEESERTEAERRLHQFLAKYPIPSDVQIHLVKGKPAFAISRLASEKQIDLLVMGTVCRTGIRGFFIGNTAEGVLRRVGCSLLTVKPEGFVSPI